LESLRSRGLAFVGSNRLALIVRTIAGALLPGSCIRVATAGLRNALSVRRSLLDDGAGGFPLTLAIEAIKEEALPRIEERHREKPFTGQALSGIQRIYNRHDKALAGPLFEGASKPVDPAEYLKFATREPGDPANGRKLFEGVATCVACHRAHGTGAQIGPDLSDVGTKYDRTFLIDSVLHPSKQILDGYHLTNVTLKNKSSVSGFLRSQTDVELLLVDAGGEKHSVKKTDVEKSEEINVSLMPEGLQSTLSLAEFADLIAYLESLKDKAAATSP